jgi:hypothetical protein
MDVFSMVPPRGYIRLSDSGFIAFKLPYIYDYITKLCRQQAEVIQNHVRNIGQGEPRHRKYKRLKLGGGQAYGRSSDSTAVVAGATKNRAWSAVLSLD